MKVRFLVGYRGILTDEVHYPPGAEQEFEEETAIRLIDEGRAFPLEVEATEAAIELSIKESIYLGDVKGSGSGGRIVLSDVRNYSA